jgi:hypothetical protein
MYIKWCYLNNWLNQCSVLFISIFLLLVPTFHPFYHLNNNVCNPATIVPVLRQVYAYFTTDLDPKRLKDVILEYLLYELILCIEGHYFHQFAQGKIFGIKGQPVVKSVYIQAPMNYFLNIQCHDLISVGYCSFPFFSSVGPYTTTTYSMEIQVLP